MLKILHSWKQGAEIHDYFSPLIHYVINFDELELMEAFEKLDTKGEKIYLEFDARAPASNMRIRVYNDGESIELKKTHIE